MTNTKKLKEACDGMHAYFKSWAYMKKLDNKKRKQKRFEA